MSGISKFKRIYTEGVAAEHPDVAGQEEFAKKADKEITRRKEKRAKKSGPQLPGFIKTSKNEEFIPERHMTTAEKAKEERIGKETKAKVLPAMQQQYGEKKGKQFYYAWKRKQAMREAFVDPETGEAPSGRSPIENVSYHPKKRVRRKAMGAFAHQMGIEYGGKWKPKTKDPTVDEGAEWRTQIGKGDNNSGKNRYSGSLAPEEENQEEQEIQRRIDSLRLARKAGQQSRKRFQREEYDDAYNYIIEMLVSADYAENYEAAEVMFEHISDEFASTILEEYIEEKARGTRKKSTVHAYDVDETLFGHGKKGKPNVQVHVKDESGKRVQSLSNQEFNTHKLQKGHSYDFSEFQSAKKFRETSSPNKRIIRDIKRKQARGQNVHLITARSKFDDPNEFHAHLQRHGINVPMKNIHYTGGMRGGDIGKKKVDVANAVAKTSGTSKTHMYDDAAKVHQAFEKERQENPTSKTIKTHMVAPDASGESRVRSYQATKGGTAGGPQKTTKQKQRARKKARRGMGEEMTAYEFWKQFI